MSKIKTNISKAILSCVNFLMPPVCLSCNSHVSKYNSLCKRCLLNINAIKNPYCIICGYQQRKTTKQSVIKTVVCKECKTKPPICKKSRSCAIYNTGVSSLIKNMKYNDRIDIGKFIGCALYQLYKQEFAHDDMVNIITNVPMDKTSVTKRLYNQSAVIAKELCGLINKNIINSHNNGNNSDNCKNYKVNKVTFAPNLVSKIKLTKRQALLKRAERLVNLQKSMLVSVKKIPNYKASDKLNILIVDDIITTGATIEEIARAIEVAIPKATISAISFARTLKKDIQ